MKKKINERMLLVAALAILSTAVLVTIVLYRLIRTRQMEDLKSVAHVLIADDTVNDSARLADLKANAGFQKDGIRVTLVASDGTVLFDSIADPAAMENHAARPEIAEAEKNGEGQDIRRSATVGKDSYYYAEKLADGRILRVSFDVHSIVVVFSKSLPVIAVLAVLLFVLCSVLSHYLTRSILRPVRVIANEQGSAGAYEELAPLVETIEKQHREIMKNAGMRQEFTANVSHELKTPLAAISGYAELIESGMTSEEDTVRFAKNIHQNSNRLLTLINDIIRLSELDAPVSDEHRELLDLSDTADSCVSMLQMNAETHEVTLTFQGTPQAEVLANRQMMEELLYNLTDNAIRYNRKGGSVLVKTEVSDGHVILTVEDTGIGIPKDQQDRVFERFYRVDKSRSKATGGTGLGLAIVKHIVAKSDAEIHLESEPGRGTVITVTFPKPEQEKPEQEKHEQA